MQSTVVTIICPNLCCRSILQVPEHTRGQKVRCGRCGHDFIVPQARRAFLAEPAKGPAQNEPPANPSVE